MAVDPHDLAAKKRGASRLYVVLMAYYFDPGRFWNHYPQFTQKCMLNKSVRDFAFVEAIPVGTGSGPPQFRIDGARGAYYAFVLAQRADGSLHDVTVTRIGDRPFGAHFVPLRTAHQLVRNKEKQFWDRCR